MAEVSRRLFLRNSGLALAGAGVMSQVPLLSKLVAPSAAGVPAPANATTAETDEGVGTLSEPLVAHIRDLSTGEIGIFNGTREIIVKDRQLAARLFRAVR